MSKKLYEDSIKKWKFKAISRRKENDYLKSRNKELAESRDNWKQKYQSEKLSHKISFSQGKKAKRHQYNLDVVAFVIELYKYGGMSLRSCRHTLICLHLFLDLNDKIPSHTSIRNWLCKYGAYRLESTKNKSDEYVVYVDESISFGSEKILLFLGVPVDSIPKDRSLSHSDVEVLGVEIGQEWTGEQVAKELSKIASTKTIKYVVSDEGTNLKSTYKLLDYSHIEDCTHILANHLKRLYNEDADFKLFSKLIGNLRQKWYLSKNNSSYMPPSMRGKMRFANIFPCVNWAKKILQTWDDLPSSVQEQVLFLKEKEEFILCSSDIIESYFGKIKTKINQNSRSGLTEFIFTIATFGKTFSAEEAKNALENIKCKELKLKKITKQAA
ncbi:hypothetical protein Fleli_2715 [Bernardetia litoralis DSM 6794]|uniref:Transposase n=1 Tax=Bernardetia litoralis (strain ATCC 23117 / DSM 6794 / NBRC 15988 / NCIMB 1366 / Fx l1 / Sio-4) TaxID=880071 RepID=I4AM85_BERLS|nr:hypothetical protein [Bernardetia litoralis]AFM05070.1 hypothetical protein Fleli_2715 [Bernardetia litoralis DSM 6794]